MNNEQYVQGVLVTEPKDYTPALKRAAEGPIWAYLVASITANTKQASLQDKLKKHLFYGKELDASSRDEILQTYQAMPGFGGLDPEVLAKNIRLVHAMIGMNTEQGEIQEQLFGHLFQNKTLDRTNLIEELGDLFWYVGVMVDTLGVTFEEVMATNNAKLRKRFGDKFSEAAALTRNLDAERAVLEGKKSE